MNAIRWLPALLTFLGLALVQPAARAATDSLDPVLRNARLTDGGELLAEAAPAAPRVPFPWDWARAHASVIDLSRFLDAPAGKGGHFRVESGHFIKPDGKRLRL